MSTIHPMPTPCQEPTHRSTPCRDHPQTGSKSRSPCAQHGRLMGSPFVAIGHAQHGRLMKSPFILIPPRSKVPKVERQRIVQPFPYPSSVLRPPSNGTGTEPTCTRLGLGITDLVVTLNPQRNPDPATVKKNEVESDIKDQRRSRKAMECRLPSCSRVSLVESSSNAT
ncbi:hypothetical protein CR513_25532, partial [Mucuna pruriens]